MTIKIWHKLALVLIISITIAVVISTLLSQHSFKNSFLEYIEQQEQRQLKNLSQNLLSRYSEDNSWDFIRKKRRVWFFYLRLKPEQNKTKYSDSKFSGNAPLSRWQMRQERMALRQERNLIQAMPQDVDTPKLKQKRKLFSLLDENKRLIVGLDLSQEKTVLYPISYNEQIIAYIEYKKATGITNRIDKIFAQKQEQAFLFNALMTLFISIIVAIFIAIYFQKRIKALTHIAKELTSGHYQQRVLIKQKDELGQLGQDFNQLAETLQKNQQSQQQWIADISHELRTPLAILKGELQALDDGIRPLNQVAVNSLQQETGRLNKLIEDLYQLSLADMEGLNYDKVPFRMTDLLTELKDNFTLKFSQKHLSLSLQCELPDEFLFQGDKQRLYQLLSNLLQNSLRYTDPDGQIIIHCETDIKTLSIRISDSSPSVAHDKLSKIFDRLYRIEGSRSREHGGSGLGLAIAKKIVLSHQGKIFAQASALGGITITIILPIKVLPNKTLTE